MMMMRRLAPVRRIYWWENDISLFRGLAARCNDMALDRPDVQYCAKEICREIAQTNAQFVEET